LAHSQVEYGAILLEKDFEADRTRTLDLFDEAIGAAQKMGMGYLISAPLPKKPILFFGEGLGWGPAAHLVLTFPAIIPCRSCSSSVLISSGI
jgi:hypothetical protein